MRGCRSLLLLALGLVAGGCRSDPPRGAAAPASEGPPPTSFPSEIDSRPVIVALGDSLTAGLGVDPERNYPAILQRRIDAAGYAYRVVNAGVSGDTSALGLGRLEFVREQRPAVVILALGANDGLRGVPVGATRRNLEQIITRLQADGTKVLLAGMELPPNYGPQYTGAFRALFPSLAREYRLPFVRFLLEGVGGHPELNQADGIHPTAEGYDRVARTVWEVLMPMLDRRPATPSGG